MKAKDNVVVKFIRALIAAILIVVTVIAVRKAWHSKDEMKSLMGPPTTQNKTVPEFQEQNTSEQLNQQNNMDKKEELAK